MTELGHRKSRLPPPPHVVWDSLARPHQPDARPWLELLSDEVEPRVVAAQRPALVVWSSLWPSRPNDEIRFDLEPAGVETALRWTLTTTGDTPDESKLGHLRFRLNKLINEKLRHSYGQ
ncbi:hypothetical protein [Amycolatopsis nigrescens]|uniref:hypothetical protein n=1 Tax=Amycolatopsis nigrescens TaxID=381445 RepID=UPI00038010D4|nr:hypothetical protein [Amycolatopsis nigrescens]